MLCEKPLTLNTAEAEEMVALAGEHDRFLMEAMWMACHPVIRAVRDELAAGRFGRPRQCTPTSAAWSERPPGDRLLDPALGGGALLDMGIYPLTLADLVLGPATALRATADSRARDRRRRRDRRPLPRRRRRGADRVDDVGLRASGRDRHRRRA